MSLNFKLILCGIILALLGVGVVSWKYIYHENQDLKKEVTKDRVVIDVQADTIDKTDKSDKITEKVSAEAAVQVRKVTEKHEQVATKTQGKVEQINKEAGQAEAAAPTPEAKAALETTRINQVSAARIDGLWDQYCLALPAAEGCAAK